MCLCLFWESETTSPIRVASSRIGSFSLKAALSFYVVEVPVAAVFCFIET
eukprot:m.69583 g.69583  ORF g.69583 m.69583 type:complete len:50 (+) comp12230_c0_seq1:240-389(+)